MVVPTDWKELEISELCVPQKSRIDPRVSGGGDICVELEHIAGGSGQLLGVTNTSGTSSLKTKFESGDVLFGKLRAYLRKYWLAEFAGVCSTEIWALSANRTRVVPGFLAQIVRTEDFIEAASVSYGTHMPRSDWSIVSKLIVSVPPLKEQEAIAEALSDADAAIESLDALIAKKRDVKQAAMQQLLTGRTRLPGFTAEWKEVSIGSFTDCKAGGTPSTSVPAYWGGNIRWMSSGELNLKRVREVSGRITQFGLENSSAQLFPADSVLIGLAGQGKTRGTAAINLVSLTTNQSIAAIFPSGKHDSKFLFYVMETKYKELRDLSDGGGGRGGLNLAIIKDVRVTIPELDEQKKISEVLWSMDDELEALTEQVSKLRMVKEGMMQDLLTGKVRLV